MSSLNINQLLIHIKKHSSCRVQRLIRYLNKTGYETCDYIFMSILSGRYLNEKYYEVNLGARTHTQIQSFNNNTNDLSVRTQSDQQQSKPYPPFDYYKIKNNLLIKLRTSKNGL